MSPVITFRKVFNFGLIKSIRPFSSFIKDENSGMKYWETQYKQKTSQDDAKINYEELYQSSYNAFQASNVDASQTLNYDQNTTTKIGASKTSNDDRKTLTHVDLTGRANMVDVGDKSVTRRSAKAVAEIMIGAEAYKLVADNAIKKGDVLSVAQVYFKLLLPKHLTSTARE
jgi:hypothetical protein